MKYPKPVMRLSELIKIGFPETWLMELYRIHNDGLAWKAGKAPNSPICFDTDRLERIRKIASQNAVAPWEIFH